jgi:hypothetical protein
VIAPALSLLLLVLSHSFASKNSTPVGRYMQAMAKIDRSISKVEKRILKNKQKTAALKQTVRGESLSSMPE